MGFLDWMDVIFNLPVIIAQTMMGLASIFLYPAIIIVNIFLAIAAAIYQVGWTAIHLLLTISDMIINNIFLNITALLPSVWVILLIVLFLLYVFIAIWKKIGGISILGFSLGGK